MKGPEGVQVGHPPTRADDCERMIRILADAPPEGLSMDAIKITTANTGEEWSLRTINSVMCDLGSQIGSAKVRTKSGNVIHYFLKRS